MSQNFISSLIIEIQKGGTERPFLISASVFEKFRGKKADSSWSLDVLKNDFRKDDVLKLFRTIISFIETSDSSEEYLTSAIWSAGKLFDKSIVPVLNNRLSEFVENNHIAMFQALSVLDNLEIIDEEIGSKLSSSFNVDINLEVANQYLKSLNKTKID